MSKTSILFALGLLLATAHAPPVHANTRCPGANQPTHIFLAQGGTQFSDTVTIVDTNTTDCNGDSNPRDFDGDYDLGIGGGFFGSSTQWDVTAGCGYDLNVHATTGLAVSTTGLVAAGSVGVDDTTGPTVVTDPSGATLSCQVDGTVTPETDSDDCLAPFVGAWAAPCGGVGGDDGYWIFVHAESSAGTLTADF